MATDAECREVAENLRYLADYPGAPVRYAEQFRDELSAVVLPDGFTHDYSELIQRLADLIEPGSSATLPRRVTDASATCDMSQMCRSNVDREALLALADELEEETGSVCGVCMGKTARRIREALGVEL